MIKRLLNITIGISVITPLLFGTVFAQGTTTTPSTEDICAKVSSDTSGFYVVLEEPLGGPNANYCFRVCTRETETVKTRICKIKSKCTSEGDKDLGENPTCQRIQVIKAESGKDLVNQYVKMIYLWAAGTVGILAVLTIVISGVQIMFQGSSGNIDTAKSRITQALFGLVVLFLSGLILYTINPTFFV